MNTITLAGGCFWCTEAIFSQLQGVQSVRSGYIGGKTEAPTYAQICQGDTGHAEAVEIVFDPQVIDLKTIFEIFFQTHNPCTLNRQGNDVGEQYRSAIFYHDEAQKVAAEAAKQAAQTHYNDPIVTDITPATTFYPAEHEHQNFYQRNPHHSYCLFVIQDKIEHLSIEFPQYLKF